MGTVIKNSCVIDMTLDVADTAMIHVCNNYGVHNSGVAKQVRDRIPASYNHYHTVVKNLGKTASLGTIAYSSNVFSLICQDDYYGRDGVYVDKKYINYGALAQSLMLVADQASALGIKNIALPMNMGADRAGGDWYVVLEMVEYFLDDFNIIVCNNSKIK